jgi:tetratricopeptide (TPR) repeat protein
MKKIGFLLLILSQFAFAQGNVNTLIDSLAVMQNNEDKARIALRISEALQDTDWKRSLHYINYAEEQAKAGSSDEFTAYVNTEIAEIYNNNDAFDVALSYFLKAYEYYHSKDDSKEKYTLENSLAIIYARLNNKERALHYFNALLKHYTETKQTLYVAKALNNIGKLYSSESKQDSALVFFNRSLKLCKQVKDRELENMLYNNLGICYAELKDYDRATTYFAKAKTLAEQNNDQKMIPWIYNSLAKLYLQKQQPDSALAYSQKAFALLKSRPFSFENLSALENLYKSYNQKQDYRNASLYFEQFNNLRDSLNIEMKAMAVEKLKLEQQHKENEELRKLRESRAQFKYLIFGFGLIILLLLCLILLNRYKNKLAKAQLEKELVESRQKELDANLELKNKELMTRSMMEIQRAEIIEHISDDLKELRLQSPKKDFQAAVDAIIKKLGKDAAEDDVWKEFELHYGQVYETFYKILDEKHPELTYRDKRLCALLKLNLSTKEIARITGQSVKSLENARTRLRKKLNLTNTTENLTDYLTSLEQL